MTYAYSQIDNSNLIWFQNDSSAHSLLAIEISRGHLRGLHSTSVSFAYPITAIAGQNGVGKTTLLALAACAYHNTASAYNPLSRRNPYYTISDFFIQSTGEQPVEGIVLRYKYLNDRWRSDTGIRDGPGWQKREKTQGGRWTNYDRRVKRGVAFLGIERVVPESEHRVLRSYSHYFAQSTQHGWENDIASAVGDVLGRDYASFEYLRHRAHRLPIVDCGGCRYSGFNMGAGESALFKLFAAIFACSDPLLLVVDELELGLHEEAQVRLVGTLKKLCKKRRLQVICTTHSGALLGAIPPEGRLFLERKETGQVTVLYGITPTYATSKLAGTNHPELDVLVEDDVGDAVLRGSLRNSTRSRIRVIPVGSHVAVVRHIAVRATECSDRAVCAITEQSVPYLTATSARRRETWSRLLSRLLRYVTAHLTTDEEHGWSLESSSFQATNGQKNGLCLHSPARQQMTWTKSMAWRQANEQDCCDKRWLRESTTNFTNWVSAYRCQPKPCVLAWSHVRSPMRKRSGHASSNS